MSIYISTLKKEHEKWINKVNEVFTEETSAAVLVKLKKHLEKISNELRIRKKKKNTRDVTLADDDGADLQKTKLTCNPC